ncbi:MAG TPA: PVC-type heme-binding CxxCH protein, partial [Verrucomicrobiae bacterium]|nr:PVC-type heme-binding CxxCH protein [Verrucomicrobiae bacterium]
MNSSLLRAFSYLVLFPAAYAQLASANAASELSLPTRARIRAAPDTNQWQVIERTVQWDPQKTAIVICDMWDQHWCAGATRRVAEMAPRMNDLIKKARAQGVFIIHCPSDTMKFYADTPGRKLAQSAPSVTPKVPLQKWCSLDRTQEAPLPIDDADGGCDDVPPCKGYSAWKQQIPTLEIQPGDAITDSAEAYYLMQERGIDNVIVMGVHLNMCVLGRPFSIRQMVKQGKNVLLMRDLTDTMYNSRQRPFVPHCVGTALMIEHVEKYWCPTISSVAFLGGKEFRFREDQRPRVVMLIGEDEYHTWETLPAFARQELEWRGLQVTVIQEPKEKPGQFVGLVEALRDADVLVLSARRRGLPKAQLDALRAFLNAGKPLIGLRTASHAFAPRAQTSANANANANANPNANANANGDLANLANLANLAYWPEFDPEVLGGHYTGHHGEGPETTVRAADGAQKHPVLTGVDLAQLAGHGSLYKASPLKADAQPLLLGSVPGQPSEPVAWTHTYGPKNARVFYTSFGHPQDFASPVFRRLLLNAVLWAVNQPIPPATAGLAPASADAKNFADHWQPLGVPGTWEDQAHLNYDGIAWYRCFVRLPADWSSKDLTLAVENVDNAHEAYFNGAKVGGAGRFPPNYQNGIDQANRYVIPPEAVKTNGWNVVALRVYDHDGRGGFKGAAPQLGTDKQHLSLQGSWLFRTGDNPAWAGLASEEPSPVLAAFSKIEDGPVPRGSQGHKIASRGSPLSPAEAAQTFTVPADLEWEQVLAEPEVRQPVFLNFDERGRMWVVQYIQYPAPAGLNVVSKDVFWRAVYDKVPEPPPRGIRGLDKITIHEDTDGDGRFDRHKTFVDGLNIATAVAQGRGGVWVLNPPYLLFYPDANHDDVPDGPPVVHLEGFGLEDTHSVVNSLRWGPDGWLYAAQGSTVTAHVRRPGETNSVYSQGQNIWRYHPGLHRYEVFAEGGGNAFGVEIDAQGRIFSGHNGGDTRGFHYMQGAYLRKGFEKHGELSNPYAFGYFPNMPGTPGERFTHNFIIYHSGALPTSYEGNLFGVEPLQGRVVRSEITADGSTFRTRDLERVVTSTDSWFRPVDIKTGPDGAIY